jgi:hypothetical protein
MEDEKFTLSMSKGVLFWAPFGSRCEPHAELTTARKY